jgi:large subunit ribosomal protein L6
VVAKGPKGELSFVANDEVSLKLEDNAIVVTPVDQSKDARSKWGMSRTMIANILTGVKDGLRAQARNQRRRLSCRHAGQNLQLALGFSHDVVYQPPKGVNIASEADGNRHHRHRQAGAWPGCCGNPRLPSAPSPTRARA